MIPTGTAALAQSENRFSDRVTPKQTIEKFHV
jgi:hypothetical protein